MSHALTDEEAYDLIDLNVKASELVRIAFPDATDDFADWFLWEKTPFPMVRGVHDIADGVAETFARGPRCDEVLDRGYCNNRVRRWGTVCHLHGHEYGVVA